MRKRRAASRTSGFEDSLWARRLIERRLRAEAEDVRRDAPARLHARTMANLDRAPRGEVVATIGGGSLAYATAAGLLLLVSVLAWVGRPTPTTPAATALVHADRGDRGVLPVIEIDPAPLRTAIERRAETLDPPWSAPLMAEARLVLADAERAAGSVLARLPGRPIRLTRSTLDVETVRPAEDDEDRPRAFPWNRLALP